MQKRMQLGNMKVSDVRHLIVETPSVVKKSASMREVLEKMNEDVRTRHVYVVDGNDKLIGSVRMNDTVKYLFTVQAIIKNQVDVLAEPFSSFWAQGVTDIMNEHPNYVTEHTLLSEMAILLMQEKINELPVVDDELKIIGQVNIYEVIKAYLAIE